MKEKKIFNIALIVFLLPTLYINFLVFSSYKIQKFLLTEFNSGNFQESTTAYFDNFNTDFPNIGVTTIPIDHFLSKYYFLAEDYEKALKLIESGNKANPYLKSGSLLKAEIFDHLGVIDSFNFYSKDAFNKMPRTPRHFVLYSKSMVGQKKPLELISAYKRIQNEKTPDYHYVFITSLGELVKEKDSLKEFIKSIKYKFSNDQLVKLTADYFLYGQKNIEESIINSNRAKELYAASNFTESLSYFQKASKLNPGDYTNFENTAMLMIELQQPQKSINILKNVVDSMIRPKKDYGKSEYLLGYAYLKLNKKDSACYFLSKSTKYNFKGAFKLKAKNCY